jgi:CelD/BcsL family acetyltransferase involved in cellulose biosynthesis
VKTEVVSELDRLEELAPEWDALVVATSRPRSAPAWILAWYRHAMVPGAVIRAVIVTDGDAIVGAIPFYVVRSGFGFYRYQLAAPVLHGVEPLCAPGRHEEVGEAMGSALAGCDPTPDIVALDWVRADSPLPRAIRAGWTRPRPEVVDLHTFPAPRVVLTEHDLEAWLAGRSKNYRKGFRNDYRKVLAAGLEHRTSTEAPEIEERLPNLRRLYEARRATRGGSGPPFDGAFMDMIKTALASSGPGRVFLSTLERPGEVIAADLVIRAGGESSAWFGGFEEEQAHLGPGRANMVMCVSDAIGRGDNVFDLGPGAEQYKYSLTADEVTLQGRVLSRRGLRPFHTPAQLLPFAARQAAARIVGRLRRSA